jgi:hypothetical protein
VSQAAAQLRNAGVAQAAKEEQSDAPAVPTVPAGSRIVYRHVATLPDANAKRSRKRKVFAADELENGDGGDAESDSLSKRQLTNRLHAQWLAEHGLAAGGAPNVEFVDVSLLQQAAGLRRQRQHRVELAQFRAQQQRLAATASTALRPPQSRLRAGASPLDALYGGGLDPADWYDDEAEAGLVGAVMSSRGAAAASLLDGDTVAFLDAKRAQSRPTKPSVEPQQPSDVADEDDDAFLARAQARAAQASAPQSGCPQGACTTPATGVCACVATVGDQQDEDEDEEADSEVFDVYEAVVVPATEADPAEPVEMFVLTGAELEELFEEEVAEAMWLGQSLHDGSDSEDLDAQEIDYPDDEDSEDDGGMDEYTREEAAFVRQALRMSTMDSDDEEDPRQLHGRQRIGAIMGESDSDDDDDMYGHSNAFARMRRGMVPPAMEDYDD